MGKLGAGGWSETTPPGCWHANFLYVMSTREETADSIVELRSMIANWGPWWLWMPTFESAETPHDWLACHAVDWCWNRLCWSTWWPTTCIKKKLEWTSKWHAKQLLYFEANVPSLPLSFKVVFFWALASLQVFLVRTTLNTGERAHATNYSSFFRCGLGDMMASAPDVCTRLQISGRWQRRLKGWLLVLPTLLHTDTMLTQRVLCPLDFARCPWEAVSS